jgi:hypothetical protein
MANGGKQITYNGCPLHVYEPGQAYTTAGNGIDGLWYAVKLSASDITG